MNLYDLNEKKKKNVRHNAFIFNQINKLTIKFYSHQQYMNICYYLKHRIPKMFRQFFKIICKNPEYVELFCKDIKNPFQFACRKWYLYNNPQG